LWPIKFDYLFDPAFYVATYKVPGRYRESASGAYRHFLTIGFPRGFAPNEATYLYPYLGGQPYPEDFNWRAYASRATPITGWRPDSVPQSPFQISVPRFLTVRKVSWP
jgi:hypothetical protein